MEPSSDSIHILLVLFILIFLIENKLLAAEDKIKDTKGSPFDVDEAWSTVSTRVTSGAGVHVAPARPSSCTVPLTASPTEVAIGPLLPPRTGAIHENTAPSAAASVLRVVDSGSTGSCRERVLCEEGEECC